MGEEFFIVTLKVLKLKFVKNQAELRQRHRKRLIGTHGRMYLSMSRILVLQYKSNVRDKE